MTHAFRLSLARKLSEEWDFESSYEDDEEYRKGLIASRKEDFIGKSIVVGLRKYNPHKILVDQTQIYGEVVHVSLSEGVVIKLKDGSEYKLPPDLSLFQFAPPGEYTLQSTGEVIVNPDLMTMWTIE